MFRSSRKREVSELAPVRNAGASCRRRCSSNARERSQTGEARDQIRERLLAGDALVLFPGRHIRRRQSRVAVQERADGRGRSRNRQGRAGHCAPCAGAAGVVTYVGLHGLPMGRENRPLFAWYGDMDLVPHLWEALKAGPIDVVVEFHPPMSVDTVGRPQSARRRSRSDRAPRPGACACRPGAWRSGVAPPQHGPTMPESAAGGGVSHGLPCSRASLITPPDGSRA